MRTFPDIRMRHLMELLNDAEQQHKNDEYAASLQKFTELAAKAKSLGISSPWVEWHLAVAADLTGDLVMAFDKIRGALQQDPFGPMTRSSYRIVLKRLRKELLDAEPGEENVEQLYRLLQQADATDVPVHLAMARHLGVRREFDRAEALLTAVTLTSPASKDAWLARAALAKQQGNALAAAGFEAEAKLRDFAEAPLGVSTGVRQ